jgi:hypothetical protein
MRSAGPAVGQSPGLILRIGLFSVYVNFAGRKDDNECQQPALRVKPVALLGAGNLE